MDTSKPANGAEPGHCIYTLAEPLFAKHFFRQRSDLGLYWWSL